MDGAARMILSAAAIGNNRFEQRNPQRVAKHKWSDITTSLK